MSLSPAEIKEILTLLEESGWAEARVTIGDVTVSVSRTGQLSAPAPAPVAAPVAAPAPVAVAAPAAGPATTELPAGTTVPSPSVGVFWRSPQPGAPPFVEVGDRVEAGDTLCIVEVMKLMNHVAAPVGGTVVAIHAANGQALEFDTPLVTIA